MLWEGFRDSDSQRKKEKNEGRGRRKKKRSQGSIESRPWIIPYIVPLASYVPRAIVG